MSYSKKNRATDGRRRLVFRAARRTGAPIAAGLLAILAVFNSAPAESPIRLSDATGDSGISFRHTDGSSGQKFIVEYVSAGMASFDYDGDGLVDLYFLNGAPLEGTKVDALPTNALYRNLGGWKFADVTEQAGVGDTGFGLGVAAADYDNDGDTDLFVNNFGPNVLYRNNGDGTFSDATQEAGLAGESKVGAGVSFLDVQGDGLLDLYVSNYVKFSYDTHRPRTRRGLPAYPSPLEYEPEPDVLYANNGDGTFSDVSDESGIAAQAGTGMGMVSCDYDDDGDTDVFVGNDVMGNFLFQNDGSGKFKEVGLPAGIAYDVAAIPHGSMGAACADCDNDGRLDLHVTSFDQELATLYRNLGGGLFVDATRTSGAGAGTFPHVTWGNGFVDFDNDGDRDIFIACGHLNENIDSRDNTSYYRAPNILLMNNGDGTFVDVSQESGDGMRVKASSRGAAFDDLDNDGDVDVAILNSQGGPTLLRNDTKSGNHWLQIRLQGVKTNRDGIGARVTVTAGDLVQIDEVHSGRGYQSHYGTRLHFGLAGHGRVDRIQVRWIGGGTDVLQDVDVDQEITVVENSTEPQQ